MAGETILVVDNDRATATMLQVQLGGMGYHVPAIATRSDTAIEQAQKLKPDLVLMDIQLGDGADGIEAASAIQKELRTPVVYVTTRADNETLSRARQTRPLGYINKPLREKDLRTTLEIALTELENRRQSLTQPASQALPEVLNYISTGVVLLEQNLAVAFTNQIARDIIQQNHQLTISMGKLMCAQSEHAMALQKLLFTEAGGSQLLDNPVSNQPLQILVIPLDNQIENYVRDMPIAIMFLFDAIQNLDSVAASLREVYGLTRAEARLATALVQEPCLEQAAATIHISVSTARSHLKKIFQKTQTNRQSSLVHRIMTGPAGLLLRVSQPGKEIPSRHPPRKS